MNKILIFILRLILAMAFSVVLTRMFHPEKSIFFMVGIAMFLIGMAYILEYVKKKDADSNGDTGS